MLPKIPPSPDSPLPVVLPVSRTMRISESIYRTLETWQLAEWNAGRKRTLVSLVDEVLRMREAQASGHVVEVSEATHERLVAWQQAEAGMGRKWTIVELVEHAVGMAVEPRDGVEGREN